MLFRKWLWVLLMNILTRTVNTMHAQCTVIHSAFNQSLYIWFSCSRLQVRLHSVVLNTFVIKLLSQLYANKSHLNTAWRPCEVRWLFSRTIYVMTLLRDFTVKSAHSHAIFTLLVCIPTHLPLSHPLCSHWTNLPKTLLEVVSCTNCLTHTCYSCMTGFTDTGGLSWY